MKISLNLTPDECRVQRIRSIQSLILKYRLFESCLPAKYPISNEYCNHSTVVLMMHFLQTKLSSWVSFFLVEYWNYVFVLCLHEAYFTKKNVFMGVSLVVQNYSALVGYHSIIDTSAASMFLLNENKSPLDFKQRSESQVHWATLPSAFLLPLDCPMSQSSNEYSNYSILLLLFHREALC